MRVNLFNAISAYLNSGPTSKSGSAEPGKSDGLSLSKSIKDLRDSRFPGLPDEYLPPPVEVHPEKLTEGYIEIRKLR